MAALSVQAPENPLFHWSSINQFDDFLFGGPGDYNQPEHMAEPMGVFDRDTYEDTDMDTVAAMAFSMEIPLLADVVIPHQTCNMGNNIMQSTQSDSYILSESSKATRWDSIHGLDFANVVDSGFECELSTPAIYCQSLECSDKACSFSNDDLIPMQPYKALLSNMDIFMTMPVYQDNNSAATHGSRDPQFFDEKTAGDSYKLFNAERKEVHGKETIPCHGFEMARDSSQAKTNIGFIPPTNSSALLGEQQIDDVPLESLLSSSPSQFLDCDTSSNLPFQSVMDNFSEFQENMTSENNKNQTLTGKGSHNLELNSQIGTTVGTTMTDVALQPKSGTVQYTNIPNFVSEGSNCLDKWKSCSFEGTTFSSNTQRNLRGFPRACFQKKKNVSQSQANRARRLAAKDRRAEIQEKKLLSHHAAAQFPSSALKQAVCGIADQVLPSNTSCILPAFHLSNQISGVNSAMPIQPNMGVVQPLLLIQSQQHIQPTFRQTSSSTSLMEPKPAASVQLQQLYPLNSSCVHLVPQDVSWQQEVQAELKMLNESHDSLPTQETNLLQNQSILKTYTSFHNLQGSVQKGVDQIHPKQQQCTSNQSPHVDCQSAVTSCSTSRTSLVEDLKTHDSLESTVLQQFERVVKELSTETRFIISDALFRLAKSAKRRHEGENFKTCAFDISTSSSSSLSSTGVGMMETKTNPIDRCVADLLFSKHSLMS
eukprot:c27546_g2_i1 orf=232-2358(+)